MIQLKVGKLFRVYPAFIQNSFGTVPNKRWKNHWLKPLPFQCMYAYTGKSFSNISTLSHLAKLRMKLIKLNLKGEIEKSHHLSYKWQNKIKRLLSSNTYEHTRYMECWTCAICLLQKGLRVLESGGFTLLQH